MDNSFTHIQELLEGELFTDRKTRILYATDASAYREIPRAVAYPRSKQDVYELVVFARESGISLIPRAAGTSLAGQVVGNGVVVDFSRYMNRILEIHPGERWIRVEPGVILDEMNAQVAEYGLFFGPETSTSNRCTIAGMVGNNACGSHSILYGSTRDHTISVKGFLSDGSEAEFKPLTPEQYNHKLRGDKLENHIYRKIHHILNDPETRQEIEREFPNKSIKRRNTGYSVDLLLNAQPFNPDGEPLNLSRLVCGSEGTLMMITEITLSLIPAPPDYKGITAAHFRTREEAFQANLIALRHRPGAVEMMDKVILDLTRDNREQQENRRFLQGDPGAILIIEFARDSIEEVESAHRAMVADLKQAGYGYAYPLIYGAQAEKVWNLRKAGLGVLSNLKGDARPVSIIEDTAVDVEMLPRYMADFQKILDHYQLQCVYHAHIGSGELHLRPIINLKDPEGVKMFRTIGREIAHLVKKYNGSLSGEHGDGRVRGEFIPIILGEKNYQMLREIKQVWDPRNIFNPGKIIDVPSMTENLRYEPGKPTPEIDTVFDFSDVGGIVRATEKCNGSGDCRKTELAGGTMCPSYMATRDENDVTRARANILREFLTHSNKNNPFDHEEIYQVMDLCLSCKACKRECPSNVDVAKLKAEFLQHYYDAHGIPLRTRMIAYITTLNRLGTIWPAFYNLFMKHKILSRWVNQLVGFAPKRSMPLLRDQTLKRWMNRYIKRTEKKGTVKGKIFLFNDEFTNYTDTDIGIQTVQLLTRLGYQVVIPRHLESGRTFLSKGLLRKAKNIANRNIEYLSGLITDQSPLVGIEPSAILTFRDEYPELARPDKRQAALELSGRSLTIEEFLEQEMKRGQITREEFTNQPAHILLHGHCQQKAIASTDPSRFILSFPSNYRVEEIPSGCCGMAGSFGYEKEHFEVSMKVGEMVLFPAVRKAPHQTVIAAPGTSCRHQISDGTGRKALHPVQVLYQALR